MLRKSPNYCQRSFFFPSRQRPVFTDLSLPFNRVGNLGECSQFCQCFQRGWLTAFTHISKSVDEKGRLCPITRTARNIQAHKLNKPTHTADCAGFLCLTTFLSGRLSDDNESKSSIIYHPVRLFGGLLDHFCIIHSVIDASVVIYSVVF